MGILTWNWCFSDLEEWRSQASEDLCNPQGGAASATFRIPPAFAQELWRCGSRQSLNFSTTLLITFSAPLYPTVQFIIQRLLRLRKVTEERYLESSGMQCRQLCHQAFNFLSHIYAVWSWAERWPTVAMSLLLALTLWSHVDLWEGESKWAVLMVLWCKMAWNNILTVLNLGGLTHNVATAMTC